MIVPGSGLVKQQAEAEGLDRIFIKAGFDWREPGCSMCLAMNPDRLKPGERCASTSNRNFEGRQGHKGRTHLVSPAMAAAAAIAGRFVDVRALGLARIPEKWIPVFRKEYAPILLSGFGRRGVALIGEPLPLLRIGGSAARSASSNAASLEK